MARSPTVVEGQRQWLVLYDGDCGFCKWLLAGLLRRDRARLLRPAPLQGSEAAALLADLSEEERLASWHLVAPDGSRRSGGEALPALLRLLPHGRAPAALFARFPAVTDRGYGWVAAHRSRLSRPVPSGSKRRAAALVGAREA